MFLVSSAEYCSQELLSEFGMLPPAFLPVGNKRLYELQINDIKAKYNGPIYLSLPQNFIIPEWDKIKLKDNDIKIIKIPINLSIGESIVYSLNNMSRVTDCRILYGDTLIKNVNYNSLDIISVGVPQDEYKWHYINNLNVVSGYFSFSNSSTLINSIVKSKYDFIRALDIYKKKIGLQSIHLGEWYDFGHIHTYFKSKASIRTERFFNSLNISKFIVEKRSDNKKKVAAEAEWFLSVPDQIKVHTPNFLGKLYDSKREIEGYKLEYLYLSNLNDLFVFSRLGKITWKQILESVFCFLKKCYAIKSNNNFDCEKFYLYKTSERLKDFSDKSGFNIKAKLKFKNITVPSLVDISSEAFNLLSPFQKQYMCLSHGDLCFSNIFFDFRSKNIKVIDPRGLNEKNEFSIYGDIRYDIAKLAHSIIGFYDLIMADRVSVLNNGSEFELDFIHNDNQLVVGMFLELLKNNFSFAIHDLYPIMVHLFLSMLPLHSDNQKRQLALLANALRLYVELKKVSS